MIWRVRFVRRESGDSYATHEYADKASASLKEVLAVKQHETA